MTDQDSAGSEVATESAESLSQLDATSLVETDELESRVKEMYRQVAEESDAELHFETGRGLAETLGYPKALFDRVPGEALNSFAGVGYHFDLASIEEGERVLDLGSGSGTDVFVAAQQVGNHGSVVGVDFTPEQVRKATRLRDEAGISQVEFAQASIDELPFDDEHFDLVISNGVINLSPMKARVFSEAARVLPARRSPRARGHRQYQAAEGENPAQHRSVGRLHRWRDPAPELLGRDCGDGAVGWQDSGQRLPFHLRTRPGRLQYLRRGERLSDCPEAR